MAHTTKVDGDDAVKQTPESVRIREDAAARCTKVIKRRELRRGRIEVGSQIGGRVAASILKNTKAVIGNGQNDMRNQKRTL